MKTETPVRPDQTLLTLGNLVKHWRTVFGWKQSDLSRKSGACINAIVNLELRNRASAVTCNRVLEAIKAEKQRAQRIIDEGARLRKEAEFKLWAMDRYKPPQPPRTEVERT